MAITAALTGRDDSGVVTAASPRRAGRLRLASFNVALSRPQRGQLARELAAMNRSQPRAVAEIIQRVRPDVLLLNEFDDEPDGAALRRFCDGYLRRPQRDAAPIDYPYRHVYPSNSGRLGPVDIDGDGKLSLPGDGYGYGLFPGHYGFALLSRLPFDPQRAREFRRLRWRQLPRARLPAARFGAAAAALRLSSKNHVDQPLSVGALTLRLLLSHPTPPTLDHGRGVNRLRNADEIRFWVDYLHPERAAGDYIVDDDGARGGLGAAVDDAPGRVAAVVMGDLNADPQFGDGEPQAIRQLLEHPLLQDPLPASDGGRALAAPRPQATASFRHGLRVDYVLPSRRCRVIDSGVYWPPPGHPQRRLVAADLSSDHRLVWCELAL